MVKRDLRQWAERDPGRRQARPPRTRPRIGFGKRFEENYPCSDFAELQQMGFPLLAGVSRKSFCRAHAGQRWQDPSLPAPLCTLAAETALILEGQHIISDHDVRLPQRKGGYAIVASELISVVEQVSHTKTFI